MTIFAHRCAVYRAVRMEDAPGEHRAVAWRKVIEAQPCRVGRRTRPGRYSGELAGQDAGPPQATVYFPFTADVHSSDRIVVAGPLPAAFDLGEVELQLDGAYRASLATLLRDWTPERG